VDERTNGVGQILKELDLEEVKESVSRHVRENGVESLAIVFLHSYANPKSEELAEQTICTHFPKLKVCRSSDVVGEIREYERASTTVAVPLRTDICIAWRRGGSCREIGHVFS
jgi:N-methylhydantoinase A/oxoprolinase/acetone carboxylase beta subunit